MVSSNIILNKENERLYTESEQQQLLETSDFRETPKDVEHNVDLDIGKIRQKLMDSAIVERYSILLEQMLCNIKEGEKTMDVDLLVHCLAEIKTDIHYLKTKLLDPPAEAVDPQAKQNTDIDKIISLNKPILIKCELKDRFVGSGWYNPEKYGRWSGPGKVSSVVLPNPVAGEYKFEMVVGAEAKPELLQTLNVNVNDRSLDTSIVQTKNSSFPALVTGTIVISEEDRQSFLAIDLIVDETVIPSENDPRLVGLLIEKISLIRSV